MRLDKIPVGDANADEVNVLIECPLDAKPIKYELDKESGTLFVDRFLYTAMNYPCNYGFIPNTLSDDGDPVDVMVYGRRALVPGCVVPVQPVGVLIMEDEAGQDEKILAVPSKSVTPFYEKVNEYQDLPEIMLDKIAHFFEQYKALEPKKWVKVSGWEDSKKAKELILEAVERYNHEK